jgi:CHAT domain-containing protein
MEERLIVFVVKPGTAEMALVQLGPSEPIANLTERWRNTYGVGRRPAAAEADPAAELSKLLWQPLREHLDEGFETILISPDGPLNGLPLAALPGKKAGTSLLEDYSFVAVPIPSLLPEILANRPVPNKTPAAVIIGDVDFDAGPLESKRVNNFSRLAGTAGEIKAINEIHRKMFPNGQVELISGQEATKKRFLDRAATADHLIIATHGFFLPESEEEAQSRLKLTRGLMFEHHVLVSNPAVRSGLVFAGANRAATVGQGKATHF